MINILKTGLYSMLISMLPLSAYAHPGHIEWVKFSVMPGWIMMILAASVLLISSVCIARRMKINPLQQRSSSNNSRSKF